MTSVFAGLNEKAYPIKYEGTLLIGTLAGGTPTDPKVAEGWLRSKLGTTDDLIREEVAKVMIEREVDRDEAIAEVDARKHLNGFKKDDEQGLYIEGRQLKAAIKEAANVRWPKERWGPSSKGTRGFFAEHVFVCEERLYLGVNAPTGVTQRFIHNFRGSSILCEEYVTDVELDFTIRTDHKFTKDQWAFLWLTGEQQGIGASRSQGFGTYEVTRWDVAVPAIGKKHVA